MEIIFLGTAAAEGWPALFCECEHCKRAREVGGKNIRTRTSLLIDIRYKVDFPPDNYFHVIKRGLDLSKIEHLLVTHAHLDHFYPGDLEMRKEPFAHLSEPRTLHVYGNEMVRDWLWGEVETEEAQVEFHLVRPFRSFRAGEMKITPLLADHAPNQVALIYVLEKDERAVLVGFDTGWYPDETWEFLKNFELDLAIFDCTNGRLGGMRGHMGVGPVIELKKALEKGGILKEGSRAIATHFSHNGGLLHHELEAELRGEGIEVAYDGMRVEI